MSSEQSESSTLNIVVAVDEFHGVADAEHECLFLPSARSCMDHAPGLKRLRDGRQPVGIGRISSKSGTPPRLWRHHLDAW